MVTDLATAIYVDDIEASSAFYQRLLGMEVVFHADWVIQLGSPLNNAINITLQPRQHDLVPPSHRQPPRGVGVTFVVEDCDVVFATAQAMGLPVLQPPTDEIYGQRRFLTEDPDGLLVDVSSPCEPDPGFAARYLSSNSADS